MRNEILNIATSLVVGSLVAFSSEVLALPYHNQELSNADALTKCEFLVAQIPADQARIVKDALTNCSTTLDNAISATQQANIPNQTLIMSKLDMARTLIGDALDKAQDEVITTEDADAIAEALEQKCSLISEVKALVEGQPLADSINQVEQACCNDMNIQIKVQVQSIS